MKKLIFATLAFLAITLFSTNGLYAQENQEKINQKELQKKQLIEKKKQIKELDSISEKAQTTSEDELKQLIEEQKRVQAEFDEQFEHSSRSFSRSNGRSGGFRYNHTPKRMFVSTSMQFPGGSGNNTTFSISKNFDDELTFSNDFEYEVPENVTGLYFTFSSELENGSLKITITKPNGKVFQVFSVAPVANVDWNKQLEVKDGESKDYAGTWKITISTKEAKGYYELRINSY
ncbi:MAG: hypothetical protein HOO91_15105 [Bacteroidales bacterium]|nr:hypothetical protein [Bacteroidales bacterium]